MSVPSGRITPGLLGLVVSSATCPLSSTASTSCRYFELKAIFAGSPSTVASISPWLSPTSSARAEICNAPTAGPSPGTTWMRTMPLPSREKIDEMRVSRRNSPALTTARVA